MHPLCLISLVCEHIWLATMGMECWTCKSPTKQITLGAVRFKRVGAVLMCTLLAADDVTWGPRAACEDGSRIANQVGCEAGGKEPCRDKKKS
ncbi:uncharacterized protein PHA67_016212 isoform 2-T2 [Liasis olivaceus]